MRTRAAAGAGATAAVLLLLVFPARAILAARHLSPTCDEVVHLPAGASYLATRDFRLNPEHPPLMKELCSLPLLLSGDAPDVSAPPLEAPWAASDQWNFGIAYLFGPNKDAQALIGRGRAVAALLATVLGLVVFLWSRRLWGTAGGLLSLLLYTLCPTILAHAPLVNTDVPLALAATASIWTLRRFGDRPAGFAAAWLLAGAGLAIKFTGLVLLPLLVILLAFDGYRRRAAPGALLLRLVAGGGLALLVLAASYGFTGLHRYFDGLAVLMAHSEAGHTSYFLGEISRRGWLLYFPVAFLVKTPLPTLLLLAMAALAGWGERRTPEGQAKGWNEETVLWLSMPAAVFFFLPILGGLDIGVRYLIPSLPFVFVLAGRVASWSRPSPVVARALVVGLVVWLASVSFAAHPDYLPYFNEAAGGSEGGARFLADSNIDWGQDLPRLAEWFREEKLGGIYLAWFGTAPPAAYGIRYRWLPGKGAGFPLPIEPEIPPFKEYLVVSVHCLLGVPFRGSDPYAWLRGRQPSVRIAPSLRVYEISGDAAAHRSLAAVYDSAGHAAEARRERALADAIEASRSGPGR